MSVLRHVMNLRTIVLALLFVSFVLPNLAHGQVAPPPPPPPLGPTVEPVSIASNNASSSLAIPGDVVTLSFTVVDIEPLITPSVTIAGHDATVLSLGANAWTASVTMLAGDAEGVIAFSAVVGSDDASATTTVEAITSGPDVVFDETAPVITLTGAPSLTLTVGDSFTDEGATTADIVDGAGTADVSGSVNTSSAGTYTLTYDKTDAAGNHAAAVTRTVTVNAAPAPAPAPSTGGQGGGSGGSLYPVAPVLSDAPPTPSVPPAPAPTAPQGIVLGAQTTNIVSSAPARIVSSHRPAAIVARAPVAARNERIETSTANPAQVAAAAAIASTTPEKIEWPAQNATVDYGIGQLAPYFPWFLLLLLVLLALIVGSWAWQKYKEYKDRHESGF